MEKQDSREWNLIDYLLFLLENPGDSAWIENQDRQAALQIKKIMDEMPGGFFIYHADGEEKIIYANKAMPLLFHCETMEEFRELTGNSFRGIVHPDDLEEVEESIKRQIADSRYELDYVEYRIIQKDGGIRWVDDYGHFVRSRYAGDVFYVFIGDSTEKKNLLLKEKAALVSESKEKEQKLESQIAEYDKEMKLVNQRQIQRMEMIEGLSIDYKSIFYADLDENIIYPFRLSPWVKEKFGEEVAFWEYQGFDKKYIDEWVYPEDQELIRRSTNADYIREKLKEEKSFSVYYRIFSGNKLEHLQLRIINVGSSEHVCQVVLGYRNIDEKIHKEMEQKKILELALSRAESAIVAKDAFLANISHDIRTPMNAIIGFTALARNYAGDRDKLLECLDQIESSSSQLMRLLQNVLETTRIEAGKNTIEYSPCDLMEILERVKEGILPLARKKQIDLVFTSTLKHTAVCSDRKKLGQILQVMVANAVKYTRNQGKVCVTAQELAVAKEYVKVCFIVEDNGIGISKEFQKRIFDPFEREWNTTISGVQGAGLGLTITKNFVDMMGGTIQVESEPGKGSRFTVTISFGRLKEELAAEAVRKEEIQAGENPTKENPENGNGAEEVQDTDIPMRILVVEDNELNMEIEAELLKEAGFLVDTAMNGRIAVEKVKNSSPGDYDIILMDIQMPIMDGYEATKAIRKLENPELANVPIIALSANVFDEDRRKSMECGMDMHMEKPIDLPQLLEAIQRIRKKT